MCIPETHESATPTTNATMVHATTTMNAATNVRGWLVNEETELATRSIPLAVRFQTPNFRPGQIR